MVFGILTQVWKREVLISLDCLGRSCASRPEGVAEKYRTFILNAKTCESVGVAFVSSVLVRLLA